MSHKNLLTADNCALMVVDIQEAFREHISQWDQIIQRSRLMIEAAKLIDLPIIVTEQYPQGLGKTVDPIREVLDNCRYYDKVSFSCLQDEKIKGALLSVDCGQVLLVGIETHVCIEQTVYDILQLNLQPYLAADALPSGSRVWTDGRTYRILRIYLNSAGKPVVLKDFTRRGALPLPGDYVLLFSDSDTTCEFCKLDYDLWRAQGNRLPLEDYERVWRSPDGKARLYRVAASPVTGRLDSAAAGQP